jgi:LmbE family N-acetylglucosaminyl deacetylase
MLYVDIILLLVATVAMVCSVLADTPKTFSDPPREVLICCAHSDDCVIMGAEYAYGAIQNDLSVKVAYLTCSGPRPSAKISRTRTAEALAAWSALGVPKDNIAFLNLSESPVSGPAAYSDQDIQRASDIFKTLIASLPKNAAVIVPAQDESHVDHRTVRKITLRAIIELKRDDLLVYETPEYNAFLSLVHSPKRTIRTLLRRVPSLNRFIKSYAGPASFVSGSSGFVFRDTPNRLAKKKELLTYFPSQDSDLLIRFFGYETRYRRLACLECLREPSRLLCISAFGCCCGPSAITLGLTFLVISFLTAHEAARGLTFALSPAFPVEQALLLLGGLFAGTYILRWFSRTASLESSLFAWAFALGLTSGAL